MSLHPPVTHRSEVTGAPDAATATLGASLALLRIGAGFAFLWAFLDKTFGLHYATPSAAAWIHGGSPAQGYLAHVQVGPFRGIAHSLAGDTWVDWLFMLGLLGVGVALITGVALRPAAAAGIVLLAMMWFLEFPPARHTAAGGPTGSNNPVVDYHVLYAAALLVLATTHAGDVWGFGRWWARQPLVRRNPWLR